MIVGHILPHFWAGVVWGTGLGSEHTPLGNFRNIKVAQLDHTLFGQEQVSALDISVADLQVMKCLETPHDLNEVVPNHFLSELFPGLLFVIYQCKNITAISMLHDNAQRVGDIFEKGFFVANHVWVVDGG
jgi:hypothetical protein